MKFRALLWLLSIFMKKAARKNPDFQKQLKDKDFAFQIKTEDGSAIRAYKIKDNQVYSKRSGLNHPAFTISFKDADTGVRILTSKDKNAFMRGIQEKDIVITGDLSLVMWFQSISKYLKPQGKKKR
ncbi:MAG: helicase [Venatoribacter sp.]